VSRARPILGPVSRENVERLRRGYAALNRGDIQGALAPLDPSVQVEDHEWSLGTAVVRHGHEGFLEIFSSVNEGFEDVIYKPEDFRDLEAQVLVRARRTGRGTASGATVEELQFHVFDFVGGAVVRFRSFLSEDKALEAVTPDA
jgi:ketosteroid isomerase-like protein